MASFFFWRDSIETFAGEAFVDDASREASTGPYAHVYPIVVFGLSSMALLSSPSCFSEGTLRQERLSWIRTARSPTRSQSPKTGAETYRERLASTRLYRNDLEDPPEARATAALVRMVSADTRCRPCCCLPWWQSPSPPMGPQLYGGRLCCSVWRRWRMGAC